LRLSVVVPATDSPATLEACLLAIAAASDPPDEVIVVDHPVRSGPAAARNAGARAASGSVLVFVDSDVLVHRDVFSRIRAAFRAEPDLVAVFGSYDDAPAAPGAVSTFRNLLHHHIHQGAAGAATTFWAGLGAVRADEFLAVRGFDAGRFPEPSVEDVDLGLRLTAGGRRIDLDPDLQGKHLKRWTFRTMVATDLLRRGMPWTGLLLQHKERALRLNIGRRQAATAVTFSGAVVAVVTGKTAVAGGLIVLFLSLNHSLYRLLLRRGGARAALAGPLLHAVHNAIALLSMPAGAVRYAFIRDGTRTRPASVLEQLPVRRFERASVAVPTLKNAAIEPTGPGAPTG